MIFSLTLVLPLIIINKKITPTTGKERGWSDLWDDRLRSHDILFNSLFYSDGNKHPFQRCPGVAHDSPLLLFKWSTTFQPQFAHEEVNWIPTEPFPRLPTKRPIHPLLLQLRLVSRQHSSTPHPSEQNISSGILTIRGSCSTATDSICQDLVCVPSDDFNGCLFLRVCFYHDTFCTS